MVLGGDILNDENRIYTDARQVLLERLQEGKNSGETGRKQFEFIAKKIAEEYVLKKGLTLDPSDGVNPFPRKLDQLNQAVCVKEYVTLKPWWKDQNLYFSIEKCSTRDEAEQVLHEWLSEYEIEFNEIPHNELIIERPLPTLSTHRAGNIVASKFIHDERTPRQSDEEINEFTLRLEKWAKEKFFDELELSIKNKLINLVMQTDGTHLGNNILPRGSSFGGCQEEVEG